MNYLDGHETIQVIYGVHAYLYQMKWQSGLQFLQRHAWNKWWSNWMNDRTTDSINNCTVTYIHTGLLLLFTTCSDMKLPQKWQHQMIITEKKLKHDKNVAEFTADGVKIDMKICLIISLDHIPLVDLADVPFTNPPPLMHADKLLHYDLCSTKYSLQITDQGVALCFGLECTCIWTKCVWVHISLDFLWQCFT